MLAVAGLAIMRALPCCNFNTPAGMYNQMVLNNWLKHIHMLSQWWPDLHAPLSITEQLQQYSNCHENKDDIIKHKTNAAIKASSTNDTESLTQTALLSHPYILLLPQLYLPDLQTTERSTYEQIYTTNRMV